MDGKTKAQIREIQRRIAEISHIAEQMPERHRMLAATHLEAQSVLLGWPDPPGGAELASREERLHWRRVGREEQDLVAASPPEVAR